MIALTAALVAALAVPFIVDGGAEAGTPQPADKVAVAGNTLEILTARISAGTTKMTDTVLEATFKTSDPSDLIIQLTAECALFTKTVTVGNDFSEATARVKMAVLLDDVQVATSTFDQGSLGDENGQIVFCDRVQGSTTERFENDNATIRNYLATRTANAFNWIVTDVGHGIHTVKVVATLEASVVDVESEGGAELPGDNGEAQAIIGQRTLVIEPVKLPVGTQV